jgi:hypothetical protein
MPLIADGMRAFIIRIIVSVNQIFNTYYVVLPHFKLSAYDQPSALKSPNAG